VTNDVLEKARKSGQKDTGDISPIKGFVTYVTASKRGGDIFQADRVLSLMSWATAA